MKPYPIYGNGEHYPKLSPKTEAKYKPHVVRINAAFGDIPIKEVTPNQVETFIKKMAAQGFSKSTVAAQLLIFNMIMKKAVLLGGLSVSPCEYVKIPSNLPKKERALPTDNEIEIIKQSVDKPFGLFPFYTVHRFKKRRSTCPKI